MSANEVLLPFVTLAPFPRKKQLRSYSSVEKRPSEHFKIMRFREETPLLSQNITDIHSVDLQKFRSRAENVHFRKKKFGLLTTSYA